jgi:hypothetical protein
VSKQALVSFFLFSQIQMVYPSPGNAKRNYDGFINPQVEEVPVFYLIVNYVATVLIVLAAYYMFGYKKKEKIRRVPPLDPADRGEQKVKTVTSMASRPKSTLKKRKKLEGKQVDTAETFSVSRDSAAQRAANDVDVLSGVPPISVHKILLLGNAKTGKSCFINMLKGKTFKRKYVATAEFQTNVVEIIVALGDGTKAKVHFEIEDGTILFPSLPYCSFVVCVPLCASHLGPWVVGDASNAARFMGAHGVVCFFALDSRFTHRDVAEWCQTVDNVNSVEGGLPLVVVGNKADVTKREVRGIDIVIQKRRNKTKYTEASLMRDPTNLPANVFAFLLKDLHPSFVFVSASIL